MACMNAVLIVLGVIVCIQPQLMHITMSILNGWLCQVPAVRQRTKGCLTCLRSRHPSGHGLRPCLMSTVQYYIAVNVQTCMFLRQNMCDVQRAQEKLQLARSQRNRLLAAFEGVTAAEDDMEAVVARCAVHSICAMRSINYTRALCTYYILCIACILYRY